MSFVFHFFANIKHHELKIPRMFAFSFRNLLLLFELGLHAKQRFHNPAQTLDNLRLETHSLSIIYRATSIGITMYTN